MKSIFFASSLPLILCFVRPMHTSWIAAAATTKFWSVKSSCNSCNWRTSSPWSSLWKCRSIVVYRVISSSRSWGNIIAYSAENKNIIMSRLPAVRSMYMHQGFGSGSGSGCGSTWIRINLICWIRIRIRIQIADPDLVPGGQNDPQK